MSVKPALFEGFMVRELMEDRKFMTRRPLKPQPPINWPIGGTAWVPGSEGEKLCWLNGHDGSPLGPVEGIKWLPGDVLFVQESHYLTDNGHEEDVVYAANSDDVKLHLSQIKAMQEMLGLSDDWAEPHRLLRASDTMPRWASRITLPVTNVRVERLHDITEEDAKAEGAPYRHVPCDHPRHTCEEIGCAGIGHRLGFAELWHSIYAAQGFGWDANPWVSVTEWKEIHVQNVDDFLKAKALSTPA